MGPVLNILSDSAQKAHEDLASCASEIRRMPASLLHQLFTNTKVQFGGSDPAAIIPRS
jgi:hypothetical protein